MLEELSENTDKLIIIKQKGLGDPHSFEVFIKSVYIIILKIRSSNLLTEATSIKHVLFMIWPMIQTRRCISPMLKYRTITITRVHWSECRPLSNGLQLKPCFVMLPLLVHMSGFKHSHNRGPCHRIYPCLFSQHYTNSYNLKICL